MCFAHNCSYLELFRNEKYNFNYNRIRYSTGVKSSIACVMSHNYAKIKVGSHDSLPLEKKRLFIML